MVATGNSTISYAIRYQSIGAAAFVLNASFSNAIYQGLYGPEPQNPPQLLPFTCHTGNCTWDHSSVTSLGVCSQFSNLTSQLETLPSNITGDATTEIKLSSFNQTTQSVSFGSFGDILSGFTLVGNVSGESLTPIAYEYIWYIYVCITYDTSIGQGIINQTIVEEWHNSHWPANYYS